MDVLLFYHTMTSSAFLIGRSVAVGHALDVHYTWGYAQYLLYFILPCYWFIMSFISIQIVDHSLGATKQFVTM